MTELKLGDSSNVYVIARCPSTGRIFLGGLGALGVGSMWVTEEDRHQSYRDYATAQIVDREVFDWRPVV